LFWGAVVAISGGIDARIWTIVIRSRDPFRALSLSFLLFLVQGLFYRRAFTADIDRASEVVLARARAVAACLALALATHAVVFGTFSAGGSDAFGYVNQAYDWAERALPRPIPLSVNLAFDTAEQLQAPLGYRKGPQPQTIVPTYAPGLPLIMAAALVFGACGPFLVVPAFAALFVWFTFRLGVRAGGPATGLAAAMVLSVSPVVLYQAVWPMSDIPAGALWTGASLFALGPRRRDSIATGLLTAVALLVRPNLLPVALVPVTLIAIAGSGRERIARLAWLAALVAPAVVLIGWLNTLWFGSPFNSGYGSARDIYEWSNVVPNLKSYSAWLWQSQTPWMLVALLPFVPALRRHLDFRTIAACLLLCVLVTGCYVSYGQFEDWWYLRFLLPTFGGLAILAGAGLVSLARTIPRPYGHLGAALIAWLLVSGALSFAAREGVFGRIRDSESRYASFGEFAAASLPANAALVAVQHSGSLRFYSGRLMVRFDEVESPRSRELPGLLERAGYHPFLVIDDAETASVRSHFGLADADALPWPIAARMRELGGVTVYDMAASGSGNSPIALEPSTRSWCDARRRAPQHR
jgi:hypothetical protein